MLRSSHQFSVLESYALADMMHGRHEKLAIGVDLGGTSVRVGAFDGTWKLIDSRSMVTRVEAGPDAVVADIADAIRDLINGTGAAANGTPAHRLTIGVGSPGPLNLRYGTLGHLPNFPGWDGFPLRQALEDALGVSICLDGDANAAALAEWRASSEAGEAVNSMCMLTLGTGVGSGILLDGKIWHGMVGMGGEAGHIPLVADGPVCGCGGRGCLEVFASATALCRMAREAAAALPAAAPGVLSLQTLVECTPGFSAREVADLAVQGDAGAIQAYERLGFYLGYALAGLVNTLDLPLYVIGGGLASAWDLFAPSIFRTVREYSYIYRLSEPSQLQRCEPDKTCIRPARLGPAAGLLGAAMLPGMRS
ncbi:MAG TPA: ROK family protein [Acidisarcina sp.]